MNPRHPRWRQVDAVGMIILVGAALIASILPWIDIAALDHERAVTTAFGIGMYLGTFALASILFAYPQRTRHSTSFSQAWRGVLGWIWRWHGLVTLSVAFGALCGTVLYTIGGIVLGLEGTAAEFAVQGVRDGAFYLLIWAPGGALVFCIIQAFGPYQQDGAERGGEAQNRDRPLNEAPPSAE